MLLKILKLVEKTLVVLAQQLEYLLDGIPLPSPLQPEPNQKLVALNCGVEASDKAINRIKITAQHVSTFRSSIKLCQPSNFPPFSHTTRMRNVPTANRSSSSRKGKNGMNCDGNGCGCHSHGSGDEAKSRTGGGTPEEANPRPRLITTEIKLFFEVRQAVADVVAGIVGIRERVVAAIELEEEIKRAVTIGES